MRIAFDNDDVITKYPDFFSVITNALVNSNHEVYIITDSDNRYRSQIEKQLKADKIAYTTLVITSRKEQYCHDNNIKYMMDDTSDYFNDPSSMFVCKIN